MISPEELEAIRKRVEAISHGEWVYDSVDEFISTDDTTICDSVRPANATFIAHAHTDVPALLATIAEVRAELVEHFDDIDLDYEGQPNDLGTMVRQAAGQLHEARSWSSKETERANVAEHKNSQLRSRFALELASRTTPDMAELQRQANRITELEESARDERWMVETLAKALRVDLGAHCITELVHAAAARIEKLNKINGGLRKWQDVERPKLVAEVERLNDEAESRRAHTKYLDTTIRKVAEERDVANSQTAERAAVAEKSRQIAYLKQENERLLKTVDVLGERVDSEMVPTPKERTPPTGDAAVALAKMAGHPDPRLHPDKHCTRCTLPGHEADDCHIAAPETL